MIHEIVNHMVFNGLKGSHKTRPSNDKLQSICTSMNVVKELFILHMLAVRENEVGSLGMH